MLARLKPRPTSYSALWRGFSPACQAATRLLRSAAMARPPRVKGFAYVGFHRYFVTTATYRRVPWFSDSHHAGSLTAQISPFFAEHAFEVVAFCVMPDHVHLLLEGAAEDADLRHAVPLWKQRTGHWWRSRLGSRLWQPGFHDHVLREQEDTRSVVGYLLLNPVRAGLVTRVEDYPWVGSSRYAVDDLQRHTGDWSPSWSRRG